jgi:hypothetical protein
MSRAALASVTNIRSSVILDATSLQAVLRLQTTAVIGEDALPLVLRSVVHRASHRLLRTVAPLAQCVDQGSDGRQRLIADSAAGVGGLYRQNQRVR